MKINVPSIPKLIIESFYENGYEAFVVGGCVRDSLLGLVPNDWDICTSAKPHEVISIFKDKYKIIETGLKHGTVTLIVNGECFEVTTYRIDGEYENNRKPVGVEFTSSIKMDLSRRDFTINAMAYNDKVGLVDYFNGKEDLENKIIRCVGDAYKRFNEDALRILRAYRFMAKLKGFDVDENLLMASKDLSCLLKNISKERIREEFNKVLLENPYILNILYEQGILNYIIPEMTLIKSSIQKDLDLWEHTITALANSKKNLSVRLAIILNSIGKSSEVLKRLKYDNKTIEKVIALVEYYDCSLSSSASIKRILSKIGEDNFKDLLEVKHSYICSQNSTYKDEKLKDLESTREKLNKILIEKQCFNIKDLKINGKDLISLGMKPGKEIGETLETILEMVIEDETLNTKEQLINIVKAFEDL